MLEFSTHRPNPASFSAAPAPPLEACPADILPRTSGPSRPRTTATRLEVLPAAKARRLANPIADRFIGQHRTTWLAERVRQADLRRTAKWGRVIRAANINLSDARSPLGVSSCHGDMPLSPENTCMEQPVLRRRASFDRGGSVAVPLDAPVVGPPRQLGLPTGATLIPRVPPRSMNCCTAPEALACSTNSLV